LGLRTVPAFGQQVGLSLHIKMEILNCSACDNLFLKKTVMYDEYGVEIFGAVDYGQRKFFATL
jgi:hypothetical protein